MFACSTWCSSVTIFASWPSLVFSAFVRAAHRTLTWFDASWLLSFSHPLSRGLPDLSGLLFSGHGHEDFCITQRRHPFGIAAYAFGVKGLLADTVPGLSWKGTCRALSVPWILVSCAPRCALSCPRPLKGGQDEPSNLVAEQFCQSASHSATNLSVFTV